MNFTANRLNSIMRPATRPQVRALALLCIGAGLLGLYMAAFPVDPSANRVGRLVDGGLAIASGLLCWVLTPRFRVWMLHLATSVSIAWASVAISQASTLGAAVVGIATLLWTGVYVGAFYGPRSTRLYALALWTVPAAAFAISAIPDAATLWVAFGAAFAVTVEILNRLSTGLRRQAVTDPLTGLLNRNGFLHASEQALARSRRAGTPVTVAHIDLDGFKDVNDRFGHLEGDRVLKLCADAWRAELRGGDILGRLGGDEFVLVLIGAGPDAAHALLDRLRGLSPIEWSYGLAEVAPGEDVESCLARADEHLYEAKARRGRPAGRRASASVRLLMPIAYDAAA